MAKEEPSWVKIDTRMYDNSKLKQIDSMENNNLIHYIWISSILLAGKCNCDGELYLTDDMPYTLKTLAVEFKRTFEEVKEAFNVLRKLKMIELTEDRVFRLRNWEKHQNVEGLNKIRKQTNERVARYREKKREEKMSAEESKKAENKDAEGIIFEENSKENSIEGQANKDVSDKTEMNINDNTPDESIRENNSVTCNDTNGDTDNKKVLSVTQENKKEIKKQNKKRIESENKSKNNSISNSENIYSKAIELAAYCEKLTGRIGLLDIDGLNMAIELHGSENVKKAIEKSIASGKINTRYILGILKNWRVEGYPVDDVGNGTKVSKKNYGGGKLHGTKCNGKSAGKDTNEFNGFKAKEPPKLSEAERKKASADVI